MASARQKLLSTLAHKSFRLGEFKLSSGGTSDYYIDCRTTTLDAKGSRLTGEVFFDEIRQRGWKAQAIGGLTMGADPIVVAVAVVSGDGRVDEEHRPFETFRLGTSRQWWAPLSKDSACGLQGPIKSSVKTRK